MTRPPILRTLPLLAVLLTACEPTAADTPLLITQVSFSQTVVLHLKNKRKMIFFMHCQEKHKMN